DVGAGRGGDQEEDTGSRASLVQLTGRVQIARPDAKRRRDVRAVADIAPQLRQIDEYFAAGSHVSQLREVITRGERAHQLVPRPPGQCFPRLAAGGQRHATWKSQIRRRLGERASRLVPAEQVSRRVFRLLHIRLIEGVDLEECPGDGSRDLPAYE